MKKLIINTVVFVCVYALLHVFVICMFGKKLVYYRIGSYGHMYSRIKEMPSHNSPDILFLGSSRSYRGFDSRIFLKHGITTFNLGSSSQTPKQTEVLLKKYLAKINPKMILFEVYPGGFIGDGIESTTDLISNDHIDVEICKLAIKSGNVKVMNTLIYGLYQEYVCSIRESFVEDRFKDGDMYVSGGFVEKLDYSPFVGDTAAINAKPITIRRDQLHAFKQCINIIKSNNIPYLLLLSPLPKSSNQKFSNIDEFGGVMSSYGRFIDFNTIIQLEDSCFYDAAHLSQDGVQVFNESLIQMLDTIELKEYE
jgi:hypothetical protein